MRWTRAIVGGLSAVLVAGIALGDIELARADGPLDGLLGGGSSGDSSAPQEPGLLGTATSLVEPIGGVVQSATAPLLAPSPSGGEAESSPPGEESGGEASPLEAVAEPAAEVLEPVVVVVTPAVEVLTETLEPVSAEVIPSAVEPVLEALEPVAATVAPVLAPAVGEVGAVADPLVGPLVEVIEPVGEALAPVAAVTAPVVGAVVLPVLAPVEPVLGVLSPVLDTVVTPVLGPVEPVLGVISPVLDRVVTPILGPVVPVVGPLSPVIGDMAPPAGGSLPPDDAPSGQTDEFPGPYPATVAPGHGAAWDTPAEPVVPAPGAAFGRQPVTPPDSGGAPRVAGVTRAEVAPTETGIVLPAFMGEPAGTTVTAFRPAARDTSASEISAVTILSSAGLEPVGRNPAGPARQPGVAPAASGSFTQGSSGGFAACLAAAALAAAVLLFGARVLDRTSRPPARSYAPVIPPA